MLILRILKNCPVAQKGLVTRKQSPGFTIFYLMLSGLLHPLHTVHALSLVSLLVIYLKKYISNDCCY